MLNIGKYLALAMFVAWPALAQTPPTVGQCVAVVYQTGIGLPSGWTPCTPGMTAPSGGSVPASGGWVRMAWRGLSIADATPANGAAAVVPCKGMWCVASLAGSLP